MVHFLRAVSFLFFCRYVLFVVVPASDLSSNDYWNNFTILLKTAINSVTD